MHSVSPEAQPQQAYPLSREVQEKSLDWFAISFMALFHVGAVLALFFFTWQALAVALVLWYISICLGIGVGYHRLLTHRGYKVPRVLEYCLAVCGTLALEHGPLHWVVNHRIHHQLADQHGDPHTPRDGGWWSHAGWVLHGKGLEHQPALFARYAPDLLKDPFLVRLSKYHWVPLLVLTLLLLAAGAALLGRALSVYGLTPVSNLFTERISYRWQHILAWGEYAVLSPWPWC